MSNAILPFGLQKKILQLLFVLEFLLWQILWVNRFQVFHAFYLHYYVFSLQIFSCSITHFHVQRKSHSRNYDLFTTINQIFIFKVVLKYTYIITRIFRNCHRKYATFNPYNLYTATSLYVFSPIFSQTRFSLSIQPKKVSPQSSKSLFHTRISPLASRIIHISSSSM